MNKHIIIDWCSELKDLDETLSKEYNIIIKDNEHMEATVEGESTDIINFLTSVDYGKSIVDVNSEFPELFLIVNITRVSSTRLHQVLINGVDFGDFDDFEVGIYSYFPKRQNHLTGDHYIAIGEALNELNKANKRV